MKHNITDKATYEILYTVNNLKSMTLYLIIKALNKMKSTSEKTRIMNISEYILNREYFYFFIEYSEKGFY